MSLIAKKVAQSAGGVSPRESAILPTTGITSRVSASFDAPGKRSESAL
jgi:hypothetical protein